jgi:hypothetical protein
MEVSRKSVCWRYGKIAKPVVSEVLEPDDVDFVDLCWQCFNKSAKRNRTRHLQ